jgi:acetylornithine deacetylase/succinyl-diaminopimelate desuccinylase-like protein
MGTHVMDPTRVHEQIDKDWPNHLVRTQHFVRQPSISADGTGIQEMAGLLVRHLQELGARARIIPTDGHPVVYGALDFGAPKTLVIYGMYDVQPVAGETWMVPPFGGEIVDLPGFGRSLVSRGIGNSKGPLASFFNMIESFQRVYGRMPVNLRFVIEGEEEQSSKHLPQAIAVLRDELRRCDAVFFPAYAQNTQGQVLMRLGAKGILSMELVRHQSSLAAGARLGVFKVGRRENADRRLLQRSACAQRG